MVPKDMHRIPQKHVPQNTIKNKLQVAKLSFVQGALSRAGCENSLAQVRNWRDAMERPPGTVEIVLPAA